MFEELKPHLTELRKRLTIIVASLLVFFILAFVFHEPIMKWMIQPLADALNTAKVEKVMSEDNKTVAKAGEMSAEHIKSFLADGKITTHQVGGAFFVALKLSFFAAILFAMPVILFQLWLFIAPGLYSHEKKMVLPFVLGGTVMFITGALFAYYIVTPFGFEFLLTFGSFTFTPYINIEDYVGFFSKIMLGFGIAFQLPVFTFFLALIGLVTDRSLIEFFKYAIVLIFLVSALLTPPDVMTQLLMAGPLVLLYGLSIIIAKMVNPYKEDPFEADEADEKDTEARA